MVSSTLQEVKILPTLIYFPPYGLFGCVFCPKGLFGRVYFYPKRLFGRILGLWECCPVLILHNGRILGLVFS